MLIMGFEVKKSVGVYICFGVKRFNLEQQLKIILIIT